MFFIACSILWSAQTVSTAAYAQRSNPDAASILAAVATAEVFKALATGWVAGWSYLKPNPNYLACAFCSVLCSALSYVVLERTDASNYVPLLAVQHAVSPLMNRALGRTREHSLASAILGAAAYAVVAAGCSGLAAAGTLAQSAFVCYAEAIDTETRDPKREHFTASIFTAWTAFVMLFGAAVTRPYMLLPEKQPYALLTIALVTATGMCRARAASWGAHSPALATAAEAMLVTGGAIAFTGSVPSTASAVGTVLAVMAAAS